MRRAPAVLAAFLIVTTALSGCGDASESLDGVAISGDLGEQPEVETTEDFVADGTQSAEVTVGDGTELAEDSVIEAKVGLFDDEGNLIQGNYDRDQNETLDLGAAQAPWFSEIVGARVGSRVAVALPVSEVLGPDGAPQAGLEPDEPMLFLVDVLEEAEGPLSGPEGESVEPPADAPAIVEEGDKVTGVDFSDAPKDPPGKLQVIPLIEGEGPEVEEGQQVTLNYLGVVWGEDKPFDSSYERGEPTAYPISKGSLIDGWVEGIPGVKVGSRVMLIIPPELGYGAQGGGPGIPGNATLVFVIDVLGTS